MTIDEEWKQLHEQYDGMKKAELVRACKEKEIPFRSSACKGELIGQIIETILTPKIWNTIINKG